MTDNILLRIKIFDCFNFQANDFDRFTKPHVNAHNYELVAPAFVEVQIKEVKRQSAKSEIRNQIKIIIISV